ncbi:MAG: imidazoleglycerol-phosphate dehydratase HisB [Lachnospiraceae bacterium]|nr:imidazoleglycerol-phosphate dehydratase HisB [Lachnospiraceae bacterium]
MPESSAPSRRSSITRKTRETDISLTLDLDGSGVSHIDTGIGFFDHMLDSFARHGLFDLTCTCRGDLHVDSHHTIEDTGIVLGAAIREAAGGKAGICRYGSFAVPMDETLILCAADLCGRPYFSSNVAFSVPRIGDLDTEMVREFFYALSYSAAMNLHFHMFSGGNNHHMAEASFKAFARALDQATRMEPRISGVWSTKGAL